jgi:hypothetical protein
MKHWSSILLITLVAGALMQLYRAHVEMEYTCEVLAFQVSGQADMLKGTACRFGERTRLDGQKIAELEAKLKALNPGKTQVIDNGSAPAAHF